MVVLEGIPGAASSEDRKKGAAAVFPKYSGIKIVSQQTAEYDRAKALHVMENILQAQPDIDAVYCFNDEMAMGALSDKLTLTAIPSVLQFSLGPAP